MERILRFIFNFRDAKLTVDDDYVDRLSRRHSLFLLVVFALLVIGKQYVGDPIHCWSPAEFTDVHKRYADSICWVSSTYRLDPSETALPQYPNSKNRVSYYQWVPLILLFQAVLMSLPNGIWRILYKRSGINVAAILDAAIAGQRTSYADIREKTVRYMVGQIERYLGVWRTKASFKTRSRCCSLHTSAVFCCTTSARSAGNYLAGSYLLVKILYILNAIGQIFLLDFFLQAPFHYHGFKLLVNMIITSRETDPVYFDHSELFPRVAACYFDIRKKGGQLHRHVVQCVLPINLFNEKLFLFLWAWFVFIAIITVINFIYWSILLLYWPTQSEYVFKQLYPVGSSTSTQKSHVRRFSDSYLRRDGLLVVRLISKNTGSVVAAEVLEGLWDLFSDNDGGNSTPEGLSRELSVRSDLKKSKASAHKSTATLKENLLREAVENLDDV
ncbi:DgyrCDS1119 [Dimorphilus gyrociliatus]|uniref:Innexin n=1 Tax=Dimorphilus gyrociliatus TaxID=2664684 RepID=A0A7I8V6B8_9ANNE|nr:DgyrCDS1119 [Dimorphilus gyrociliatus]